MTRLSPLLPGSWWEVGNQFCIVISPHSYTIGWLEVTWSVSGRWLVNVSCILIGTLSLWDWSSLKTCQNWMKFKQSKINWAANFILRFFVTLNCCPEILFSPWNHLNNPLSLWSRIFYLESAWQVVESAWPGRISRITLGNVRSLVKACESVCLVLTVMIPLSTSAKLENINHQWGPANLSSVFIRRCSELPCCKFNWSFIISTN